MESVLSVAKFFNDMYLKQHGYNMDEMKMHKMMYFAQREFLLEFDQSLFNADFYGWKFGPVLKEVREEYKSGNLFQNVKELTDVKKKRLLSEVYNRYENMNSWDLSNLSHQELSWKKAREGLEPSENGDVKLSMDMMRIDAVREKLTRAHYGL